MSASIPRTTINMMMVGARHRAASTDFPHESLEYHGGCGGLMRRPTDLASVQLGPTPCAPNATLCACNRALNPCDPTHSTAGCTPHGTEPILLEGAHTTSARDATRRVFDVTGRAWLASPSSGAITRRAEDATLLGKPITPRQRGCTPRCRESMA